MKSSKKHITDFNQWVRIMESSSQEEVELRLEELNSELGAAATNGRLTTREFMDWFNGMLNLYDTTNLSTLIFRKMKETFQRHYSKIEPILSKSNAELTREDITSITRYKSIAADEARFEKDAESRLKDLGLF
jgi:hypothetical protein